jgi:hypothetical protein
VYCTWFVFVLGFFCVGADETLCTAVNVVTFLGGWYFSCNVFEVEAELSVDEGQH